MKTKQHLFNGYNQAMEYEPDDMPMVYFYEADLEDGRFAQSQQLMNLTKKFGEKAFMQLLVPKKSLAKYGTLEFITEAWSVLKK